MIRATMCNETLRGGTVLPMRSAVWFAPVRNLTWVSARFGYR